MVVCLSDNSIKYCKSLFKLGKEFQAKSYNLLVAHTTIVFIRHMVMLYLSQTDEYCMQKEKTINKCYFDFSEFVKYIDLAISFQLLCLIEYMLGLYCKQVKDIVSCQVGILFLIYIAISISQSNF